MLSAFHKIGLFGILWRKGYWVWFSAAVLILGAAAWSISFPFHTLSSNFQAIFAFCVILGMAMLAIGFALPPDVPADRKEQKFFSTERSEASPVPPKVDGVISANACALSSVLALDPDEALVLTDAQSNTLWVNEAFTRMCGYDIRELLGRNAESLLQGPKTDQAAEARMRRAVAGGRSCTEEIVNYRKDGHPYWVRLMINPLSGPDGVVRGFLAVEQQMRDKQV